ncbi:accessory protein regulator protein B [compost metagenome]
MGLIDKLCNKLLNKLLIYQEHLPPQDVIFYFLKLIIHNLITIMLILITGISFDVLNKIILSAIAFAVLRTFAGGRHIKSSEICILASVLMLLFISLFSHYIANYITYVNILTLSLTVTFSPLVTIKKKLLSKKKKLHLKVVSITLVLTSFYLNNIYIAISFLIEALLLISMKGGEKDE